MKLVTFQTFDALKSLINNGKLICDAKYINLEKAGLTYKWVLDKMNEFVPNDGYRYGSLNYIRSNGKRIDWQKDYYKLLK